MKAQLWQTTVMSMAAGLFAVTGCDQRVVQQPPPPAAVSGQTAPTDGGVEVATEPPPAPEADVVTASPGPDYVWIGGAWTWGGSKWAWEHGRWDRRPSPGAVWAPHRVETRGGHRVFVRGGWH